MNEKLQNFVSLKVSIHSGSQRVEKIASSGLQAVEAGPDTFHRWGNR